MLITTAAVHGGASGGALVDAQGQLVGLVTSNAKHARGATLPHCNFCIAAEELRPVWAWVKRHEQQQQQLLRQQQQQQGVRTQDGALATAEPASSSLSASSTAGSAKDAWAALSAEAAAEMLRELRALDVANDAGVRLWALLPPKPPPAQVGGSGSSSSKHGGGLAAVAERLGKQLHDVVAVRSRL